MVQIRPLFSIFWTKTDNKTISVISEKKMVWIDEKRPGGSVISEETTCAMKIYMRQK